MTMRAATSIAVLLTLLWQESVGRRVHRPEGQSVSISRSSVWQPGADGRMHQLAREIQRRTILEHGHEHTGSVFQEWEDGERKKYIIEGEPTLTRIDRTVENRPLLSIGARHRSALDDLFDSETSVGTRPLVPDLGLDPLFHGGSRRSLVPDLSFDVEPFMQVSDMLDMSYPRRMGSLLRDSLLHDFDRRFAPLRGRSEVPLRRAVEFEEPTAGRREVGGKTPPEVEDDGLPKERSRSVSRTIEFLKNADGKVQGKEVIAHCEDGVCKMKVERDLSPDVVAKLTGAMKFETKEEAKAVEEGEKGKLAGTEGAAPGPEESKPSGVDAVDKSLKVESTATSDAKPSGVEGEKPHAADAKPDADKRDELAEKPTAAKATEPDAKGKPSEQASVADEKASASASKSPDIENWVW